MTLELRWQPGAEVFCDGQSLILGRHIGGGREAEVFGVDESSNQEYVVKLYGDPGYHEARIHILLSRMDAYGCHFSEVLPVAAPDGAVLDPEGKFCGIRIPNLPPTEWVPVPMMIDDVSEWDITSRLKAVLSLSTTVGRAQNRGFILNDLTPPNLFIHKTSSTIALIDTDSWGWEGIDDRVVGHIERRVLDGVDPSSGGLTKEGYSLAKAGVTVHDPTNWALALIILEMLMGLHPFGCDRKVRVDDHEDIEDRIRDGACWLFSPQNYILPKNLYPNGHPGIQFLPPSLQQLAYAAFTTSSGGMTDSYPPPEAWSRALKKLNASKCQECGATALANDKGVAETHETYGNIVFHVWPHDQSLLATLARKKAGTIVHQTTLYGLFGRAQRELVNQKSADTSQSAASDHSLALNKKHWGIIGICSIVSVLIGLGICLIVYFT